MGVLLRRSEVPEIAPFDLGTRRRGYYPHSGLHSDERVATTGRDTFGETSQTAEKLLSALLPTALAGKVLESVGSVGPFPLQNPSAVDVLNILNVIRQVAAAASRCPSRSNLL